MPKLLGTNAHEVAQHLHADLSGRVADRLFLLPYNRFKLGGENTWWLSPTSENPAYKRGKLFCSNSALHGAPTDVRCGLHIEKGFETSTAEAEMRLGSDWQWHPFIADLVAGSFDAAADGAAATLGEALRLLVIAYPYDTPGVSDQFHASIGPGGVLTGSTVKPMPRSTALSGLSGCGTLRDLGTRLNGPVRRSSEWYWIDIYVSGRFDLVSTGADDTARCSAMLDSFTNWVR